MRHTVVMGVCGCGKSTVASKLALRMNGKFVEADTLHSPHNVRRMRNGQALTDSDRWPWLSSVGAMVNQSLQPAFVSCSALRRSYRDYLRSRIDEPVVFIHLTGRRDVLLTRMNSRENHFMPIGLLDSQLDTLEVLQEDEIGVQIDICLSVEQIVNRSETFFSNL